MIRIFFVFLIWDWNWFSIFLYSILLIIMRSFLSKSTKSFAIVRHLCEGNPYDSYFKLVTLPSNCEDFHLITLITISTFDISCYIHLLIESVYFSMNNWTNQIKCSTIQELNKKHISPLQTIKTVSLGNHI